MRALEYIIRYLCEGMYGNTVNIFNLGTAGTSTLEGWALYGDKGTIGGAVRMKVWFRDYM